MPRADQSLLEKVASRLGQTPAYAPRRQRQLRSRTPPAHETVGLINPAALVRR